MHAFDLERLGRAVGCARGRPGRRAHQDAGRRGARARGRNARHRRRGSRPGGGRRHGRRRVRGLGGHAPGRLRERVLPAGERAADQPAARPQDRGVLPLRARHRHQRAGRGARARVRSCSSGSAPAVARARSSTSTRLRAGRVEIPLRRDRIARLLGVAVDDAEVTRILAGLGFDSGRRRGRLARPRSDDARGPSARGRPHRGGRAPPRVRPRAVALPAAHGRLPRDPTRRSRGRASLRHVLTAAGFSEAVTFASSSAAGGGGVRRRRPGARSRSPTRCPRSSPCCGRRCCPAWSTRRAQPAARPTRRPALRDWRALHGRPRRDAAPRVRPDGSRRARALGRRPAAGRLLRREGRRRAHRCRRFGLPPGLHGGPLPCLRPGCAARVRRGVGGAGGRRRPAPPGAGGSARAVRRRRHLRGRTRPRRLARLVPSGDAQVDGRCLGIPSIVRDLSIVVDERLAAPTAFVARFGRPRPATLAVGPRVRSVQGQGRARRARSACRSG